MSKPIINVVIQPDGIVEVSVEGVKGKACKDKSKFLEEALGLDTSKSKPTPEMYQTESVKIGQKT
jgi:hypothetical protein